VIIYFGETVIVHAQGQTWRGEKCEHCGQRYYYPVTFAATAEVNNPWFQDTAGSWERAEKGARDQLQRALDHEVLPVPCPHCTKYQRYMLPAVRDMSFPRMRLAGRLLLGSIPMVFLLGCVIGALVKEATGQDRPPAFTVVLLLGLPLLPLIAGLWLLIARRRKQENYDPNSEEYKPVRRRLATAYALTAEQFAQFQIPPPELGPPAPRRGQLVGQNCVRCGERIPDELESRFCAVCGRPVHNRCAVPAEGGCSVCGATAP
jgi:hypothetical protein